MNPQLSAAFCRLTIVFAAVGSAHATGYAAPVPVESRDRLAWLGPLPQDLTEKTADNAFQKSVSKALGEIAADIISADAIAFVCRSPAEAGPAPDLDAVNYFIEGLPASAKGGKLLDDLFKAAGKGNWLAQAWVFTYLTEERPMTAEAFYRSAQLLDVMRERRAGQLYLFIGRHYYGRPEFANLTTAEGPSQFDIAAANHNSYPAQYRVGQHLQRGSIPRLKQVGNDMVSCARRALPAYAQLFKDTSVTDAVDD